MIKKYTITNEDWTAITTAGESGSCWLSLDAQNINGICRMYHSDTEVPDEDFIELGYPVYIPRGSNQKVTFSADNSNDIYYAIMDKENSSTTLIVDAIGS